MGAAMKVSFWDMLITQLARVEFLLMSLKRKASLFVILNF